MDYEVRPQRGNYNAHILTMLFFILAGVLFGVSGFVPTLSVLWQSLGVVMLLPAIQLIGKYMAVQYLYRIRTLEDGSVDLEVFTYRGGSRMQLVCRVGLWEITAVTPLGAENRRAPRGLKRYGYCSDLYPSRALVLSVTNEDGDCEVLLSYDEELATRLAAGKAGVI